LYLMFFIANFKTAIKNTKNKINKYEAKFQIGILLTLMAIAYVVTGIIKKSSYPELCILIGYIGSKRTIHNAKQ